MEKIEEYQVNIDDVSVKITILGGKGQTNLYHVDLPQIAPATKALLDNIKRGLIREVVVSTTEILDPKSISVMKKKFGERAEQLLKARIPSIHPDTSRLLINVLIQEMLGLGDIEYLTADEALEEVVITSSSEPVRVYHKKYGWLETNIIMTSEEQILNYANIIGRRVGRQITTLNPLLDAHLLTGDRANAVLFPVSTKGHTITIRKFARDPWTMTDLITNKTCTARVFALIWLATQYEMNILISGGTASGKCVEGNTEVYLPEKRERIKELVEKIMKKGSTPLDDGFVADANFSILSLNPDTLKIEKKKASKVWKRTAPPFLYKITTASGRSVTVTPEHPFFVAEDGGIFKRADELQFRSPIGVPRHIDVSTQRLTLDLSALPGKRTREDDTHIYLSGKGSTNSLRIPRYVDGNLMRFMGYIMGDGHITKNKKTVRFFNEDKEILGDVRRLGKELFALDGRERQYGKKTPYVEFSSYILSAFLIDVLGIPAGNKSHIVALRDMFHFAGEYEIKEFIRGLFEAEAGITVKNGEMEFSSTSHTLVENVAFLLSRCGIVYRQTMKNRYRIFIAGKHLSTFSSEIGCVSTTKKRDLELACNKDHSPNVDFVHGIDNLLRDVYKKLRLRQKDIRGSLSREAITRYVGGQRHPQRESLTEVVKVIKEKFNDLIAYKNLLRLYADHKNIFDKIEKIRQCTRLTTKELALRSGVDVTTINLWRHADNEPSFKIWNVANAVVNDYSSLHKDCTLPQSSYQDIRIEGREIAEVLDVAPFTLYPRLRGEGYPLLGQQINHAVQTLKEQRKKELQTIKPDVDDLLQSLAQAKNNPLKEVVRRIQSEHRLQYKTVKEISSFIERATSNEVRKKIERLSSLASSDLLWDTVVEIEKVTPRDKWVYDITIDDNHTFVANNVVVHNTSFLNVLMPFMPPNHRIVSIEDTRELQLPKFLYWCPLTVRQPNPEGKGEVSMLDLLINSLRMRPDRIILGEMRRKDQAEVLFEAMHTGHSVYATVHADSIAETIQRLINPPIEVPKNMLLGVNLNVVMFRDRRRGIRRVFQMGEFIPAADDAAGGGIRPNIIYRWRPSEDDIVEHSSSLRLFEELSRHTGMSLAQIESDLKRKQAVLEWMVKNKIRHVDNVGEVMRQYYLDPDAVLEMSGEKLNAS